MDTFPNAETIFFPENISDHCPCMIILEKWVGSKSNLRRQNKHKERTIDQTNLQKRNGPVNSLRNFNIKNDEPTTQDINTEYCQKNPQ